MQRWNLKKTHFPVLVSLFIVLVVCSFLYNERGIQQIEEDPDHDHPHQYNQELPSITYVKPNHARRQYGAPEVLDRHSRCNGTRKYCGRNIRWIDPKTESSHQRQSCDAFAGKWVFDNVSYPLYQESSCPYMSDQLACHKHGRSNLDYQYWRWQPHDCNLKRWNVTEMWEKLRGKRLMFVGDSLNRGQWISMVCLLQSVIPADKDPCRQMPL